MTSTAEPTALPRVLPRTLQASDHRAVLAIGDAATALAAVVIALWLWSIPAGWQFSPRVLVERAWWFVAALAWYAAAAAPAEPISIAFALGRTLRVLARGTAVLLIAYVGWYFYAPHGGLPRLVVLYFLWEAVLLTLAWRIVFVAIFSRAPFRQRLCIVGSGEPAALAAAALRGHRARQADVIAFVPERHDAARLAVPPIDPERLFETAMERGVTGLVIALSEPACPALLESLLACQEAGAQIVRVQTLVEHLLRRVPVDLLEPDWLLTDLADAMRVREASWWAKRAVDLAGASVGLAVLVLAFPVIALAILVDSGAPIFYRQRRIGRGGTPFEVVKFRTMVIDAEQPGEPRWADRDDPRTTRVGRLLRRLRFDELPQFWSVLRGDMSIVGPRPERPEFVAHLQRNIPFYRARLLVPPGLTGWAQVNLPYSDSIHTAREKLEHDLYYVKHRTILFDLAIILRTFRTVLRLEGH